MLPGGHSDPLNPGNMHSKLLRVRKRWNREKCSGYKWPSKGLCWCFILPKDQCISPRSERNERPSRAAVGTLVGEKLILFVSLQTLDC